MSNFRFLPKYFLLPLSKIAPPNGSCAQDASGIVVADQCRLAHVLCQHMSFVSTCALDGLLQPVLLDSASCCCQFASSTALIKSMARMAKQLFPSIIWDYPSKITRNDQIGGWGYQINPGFICTITRPSFPDEVRSKKQVMTWVDQRHDRPQSVLTRGSYLVYQGR